MATANHPNPPEDQITCSVCFNIYTEPYTLSGCLHTFCLPCIERLENGGKIQCPVCQQVSQMKDLKKDFKTKSFIDALRAQQQSEQGNKSSSAECGICCSQDNPVAHHCRECDKFMCNRCQQKHAGDELSKNHQIKPVAEIIMASDKLLKELIHEFENEQRNIHQNSCCVDTKIEEIEQSEIIELAKIKELTEDAITDLEENEKRLGKLMKEANDTLIRNLKNSKDIFAKCQTDVQNKIDFLNDLIEGQDLNILIEYAENIKDTMNESIQKIKDSLPDLQSDVKTHVIVTRSENWDVKDYLELKSGQLLYGTKTINPLLQSSYLDICKSEYVEKESVSLGYYPFKLCQIKQEIWCCGSDTISVYDKHCQKIKDVAHDQLGYIRGLTLTGADDVIVACGNGLHQLDIDGQYQTQIAEGYFSDVCTYAEQIYALDYIHGKLFTYAFNDKWEKTGTISLQFNNSSASDKLCASKDSIYVSSERNYCIYKYTADGKQKKEIRQDRNNLHISGVDSRDNILAADYDANQVKVYDRQEGSWKVVPVSGELCEPTHAMLDDEGCVWVANYKYKKITKFESK